jgi:hypothetical protein
MAGYDRFIQATQDLTKSEVDKARGTTSLKSSPEELRKCQLISVNTTYNIASGSIIKADGTLGDTIKNIRFSGTAPSEGDTVYLKRNKYSRIYYIVSGTGGGGDTTPYIVSSLGMVA